MGTELGAIAGVSTIGAASLRCVVEHPAKAAIASKRTKAIFIGCISSSRAIPVERKKSAAAGRWLLFSSFRWQHERPRVTFAGRLMPPRTRHFPKTIFAVFCFALLIPSLPGVFAHPGASKGVAVATPTPPPQTFAGIGAAIFVKDGKCVIVDFVAGSGALASGLQVSDVITHIDRREISGLDISDIVPLLRGPSGTTVTLTVDRKGTPLQFTVTRRLLKAE